MLKENLLSILAALGKVQVNAKDEEQAALVRGCRDNLRAAAEQAEALAPTRDVPCRKNEEARELPGLPLYSGSKGGI